MYNQNKKIIIIVSTVICLMLLGTIGIKIYTDNHVWAGNGFISMDTDTADFRGTEMSLEEYEQMRKKLPDSEILWDVPFQGSCFPSNSHTLRVQSLSQEDLKMLEYFPNLTTLDATGCTDISALRMFQAARPDCQVLYQVDVCGVPCAWETASLDVADADIAELQEKLPLLPNVSSVNLSGTLSGIEELEALIAQFPEISFSWRGTVGTMNVDSAATTLDLSDGNMAYGEVSELLRWMPNLEEVNLQGCGFSGEEVAQLAQAHAGCYFPCEIEVAGRVFSTNVEEMDLSGIEVASPQEIEDLLPCFPNLTKVIMCDCGLSNEEMDALNNRHENIRFVWTVYIQKHPLRTDADYFYPYKMDPMMRVTDEDLEVLRYCPDILCIDIGHMWHVTHCEWVRYMPKLKYLILGETRVSDLTPLSTCKNLVYLEIFTIPVTDYSPLVECTALEDLCLGRTYGDPAPIAKMTWLKNVWWANVHGTYGLPASNAKEVLEAALPNTVLRFDIAHPTADGWRKLQNYYDHRDLMGMHYLQ